MSSAEKSKNCRLWLITKIFLLLELIFYGSYLTLDFISGRNLIFSDYFKYGGIFLCFCYTLTVFSMYNLENNKRWLLFAVFFVLFSDFFLLFTFDFIPGVLMFCLVQCFYFCFLERPCRLWSLFIRSFFYAALATVLLYIVFGIYNILIFFSLQYIAMLFINIRLSVIQAFKSLGIPEKAFAMGMIFYCLCDLNVGLMNAPSFFPQINLPFYTMLDNPIIAEISTFSMWFFYLPAQVLIALSISYPMLSKRDADLAASKKAPEFI